MGDIALEVKDLYISYNNIKKYSIKKNFLKGKNKEIQKIEAVKGVSFTLEKGNVLGIIGKNGSGKSTMLRGIAGIFAPDKGEVDLKGNAVSLMSIGVGFNNELTGKENIMLSGMLLGFSEIEIKEKMNEIIEFSGLESFIDYPVQTYSSGMYSKLAFSITAILETDIMLVDEVLSVGDIKFRKKSLEKMKNLINDNQRTVAIVSHNMTTIKDFCNKALWLNEGKQMMFGDVKEVIQQYEEFMNR